MQKIVTQKKHTHIHTIDQFLRKKNLKLIEKFSLERKTKVPHHSQSLIQGFDL